MANTLSQTSAKMDFEVNFILKILDELAATSTKQEKFSLLMANARVQTYLASHPVFKSYLDTVDLAGQIALLQLIAIDQADVVIGNDQELLNKTKELHSLVIVLKETDLFYAPIGGILGYHLFICDKLSSSSAPSTESHYSNPPIFDLRSTPSQQRHRQEQGLEALPYLAEVYVLGGAADRLNFTDSATGEALPAALLPFEGLSLIEGLIRDLQAREYLYFKRYQRQVTVPIVLMTSSNPSSQNYLNQLLGEKKWFGRPPSSFKMIFQPLVPLVSNQGVWCTKKPLELYLRPGGHGAFWKSAVDHNVFDWLKQQNKEYLIIRQINNPIAAIDGALLTFAGIGWQENKVFGFTSCERQKGMAEGVNVLKITNRANENQYAITNVEYTDLPESLSCDTEQGKRLPANTNVLYTNIQAIEKILPYHPMPGLTLNMKTRVMTPQGEMIAGRPETLMQNIAEAIVSKPLPSHISPQVEDLPSFVLFKERYKTISPTKKEFKPDQGIAETPFKAHFDLLFNHYDLFKNHCRLDLSEVGSTSDYLARQWGFLSYINPVLGPLFEIIGQKIQGGRMGHQSCIELDIAELHIKNIDLRGSLRILSTQPIGHLENQKEVTYSLNTGKCTLLNVCIDNRGIDPKQSVPWKKQLTYHESLDIVLHENAEFYAKDVLLQGNQRFVIPAGHRMRVYKENNANKIILEPISQPSWWWEYSLSPEKTMILKKMANV